MRRLLLRALEVWSGHRYVRVALLREAIGPRYAERDARELLEGAVAYARERER